MAVYNLLFIIMLCFVYEGATRDVASASCSSYGVRGTCTPFQRCKAASYMRNLYGGIKYCFVPGMKTAVCCLDKATTIPLIFNLNFLINFYDSVASGETPITISGPTYSTGLLLPDTNIIPHSQPTTTTPRLPTTRILYPSRATASNTNPNWPTVGASATNPRWYTVSTTTPRWPMTNISSNPIWPTVRTSIPRWPTTATISSPPPNNTPSTTTTARPVATTPRPGPTTTEYIPMEYDYVTNKAIMDRCKDIDPKLTANKTGRIAWDKCIEYQAQLVYPCQRSVSLLGNMVRVNHCAHAEQSLDEYARPDELPHMVVLGTRSTPDGPLQWACTGTLISEWFVLTSAHCWGTRNKKDVVYATLGNLQRMTGNKDAYQEHRVQSIIYNGLYNGYSYRQNGYEYHDIALLKTATEVRLNQWVVPACLDLFGGHLQAMAARWRARSWHSTNEVQKVFLQLLGKAEYQRKFDSSIRKRTYRIANQMGYGSYSYSKDFCKYDNEGSLTVENQHIHCMYTVVGISSDVKANCGPAPASSFTKVLDYTSWIEKTVWPEDSNIV